MYGPEELETTVAALGTMNVVEVRGTVVDIFIAYI